MLTAEQGKEFIIKVKGGTVIIIEENEPDMKLIASKVHLLKKKTPNP